MIVPLTDSTSTNKDEDDDEEMQELDNQLHKRLDKNLPNAGQRFI